MLHVCGVSENCGDFCLFYTSDYLSWEKGGIGRYVAFLAIQGVVFFTILLVIETQVPKTLWYLVCGRSKKGAARYLFKYFMSL